MREPRVLVVDDNAAMVEALKQYLGAHRFQVETALTGEAALCQFDAGAADVVLTDLRMKGFDGMDVLEEIRKRDAQVPVVIMTAFGNVQSAVEAIQRGAYHYLTKPFEMVALRVLLLRATRDRLLREENAQLRAMFEERFAVRGLLGRSPAIREVRTLIGRIANVTRTALILGEPGTGKEAVARAIHVESERRDAPFVAADCAVRPETLLDSELFGHVRGAFRGATHARRGLLMEADGGTLFLDEVADLPLVLQAKLLRVLQTGELRPVGSEAVKPTDVHCIAATRYDLRELVDEGKFREDLYFQLSVVVIRLPVLRERPEDIAVLAEDFLVRHAARAGRGAPPALTAEALRLLESHSWPGNVRELENLIERLLAVSSETTIDASAVGASLKRIVPGDPYQSLAEREIPLDVLERRYIAAVLDHAGGNKAKAAAILGIDLSTLYRRDKRR